MKACNVSVAAILAVYSIELNCLPSTFVFSAPSTITEAALVYNLSVRVQEVAQFDCANFPQLISPSLLDYLSR